MWDSLSINQAESYELMIKCCLQLHWGIELALVKEQQANTVSFQSGVIMSI